MHITVEISLYPLANDFMGPIKEFIQKLHTYKDLEIVTNATSTLIKGEHFYVLDVLAKETANTFKNGNNVFVMKIFGFERFINKTYPSNSHDSKS